MSSFTSWQMAARARRARLILVAAFMILTGAFFKAQVLESDSHRMVSESNRLRAMMVPAARGDVLDRNGELIAESTPGYTVRLLATNPDSLRSVLARLDALVPEDSIDIEEVVNRWTAARFMPVLVYGAGDFAIVSRLQEQRAAIPGLVIQAEPRRHYPDSNAVAHLIGYAREIAAEELSAGTFPGARMGEIVGKAGLEVRYDSVIRGRPGVRYAEVTGAGRTVRSETPGRSIPPTGGAPLQTTIDLGLQRFIDSMWTSDPFLRTRSGGVFAMRPDGGVLAFYSFPNFDPNIWVGGISRSEFAQLLNDPMKPLLNRVIDGLFPPASPFKLAVAAMGLKRGLVTMSSRMPEPCTGGFQFGDRRFRCWDPEGHGSVDLTGAIKTSCDVYFYQLGLLLSPDSLLADAQDMGFGSRSGLDVAGEDPPQIEKRVRDYVNERGGNLWYGGETLNLSIGQGRHTQTLANMVTFYAGLASGGIKRAPFIVERAVGSPTFDLGISPEHLLGLQAAMSEVVNTGGTASFSGGQELLVAGKTGTGQMPGGQEDAGWFIGYAPHDRPEIVIGMVVEAGEHGSTVAQYVVKAIRRYLLGEETASIGEEVDFPVTDLLTPPSDSVTDTSSFVDTTR